MFSLLDQYKHETQRLGVREYAALVIYLFIYLFFLFFSLVSSKKIFYRKENAAAPLTISIRYTCIGISVYVCLRRIHFPHHKHTQKNILVLLLRILNEWCVCECGFFPAFFVFLFVLRSFIKQYDSVLCRSFPIQQTKCFYGAARAWLSSKYISFWWFCSLTFLFGFFPLFCKAFYFFDYRSFWSTIA